MSERLPTQSAFNIGFPQEIVSGRPRVVQTDRKDPVLGQTILQEMREFLPDGRILEESYYRSDGTIAHRLMHEYSEAGEPTLIKRFEGAEVEKYTILAPEGLSNPLTARSPIEVQSGENGPVFTLFTPEQQVIGRAEMRLGDTVRELSWFADGETRPGMRRIERVDSRDNNGNWTQKTLFEQRGNGEPKPIAELYRRIAYYET
ncbi:MAG: hypothetical protein JO061_02345 [Acidobacteriaceae bacterium]|nr:hypothetical protein [Acidobacteriaceae bacterium]